MFVNTSFSCLKYLFDAPIRSYYLPKKYISSLFLRKIIYFRGFSSFQRDEAFQSILSKLLANQLSIGEAVELLKSASNDVEQIKSFARIDHSRAQRTGMPEAIFAEGKTPFQVAEIFRAMSARRATKHAYTRDSPALATRVSPIMWEYLHKEVEGLKYFPEARIAYLVTEQDHPNQPHTAIGNSHISVVCAGTSDLPVAEEAAVTAELCGVKVSRIYDVGVAGIHRLLTNIDTIRESDVAICVAGMDGAMPSVVAGLVECPSIAVPTSIGYGACFGGIAPMLAMLNSCSPGLSVVNIDNGFGAAVCALKILKKKH